MRLDFTPRLFMNPQADLKAAKELVDVVEVLKDSFKSLGIIIKQQVNDNIQDADSFTKSYAKSLKSDLTQTFNNLNKKSEELLKNQELLSKGQAKEKDILKQITQNELRRKNLAIDLVNAVKNGVLSASEAKKIHTELIEKFAEQNEELAEQAKYAAKTAAVMGNLGSIVKGLNKIPILGSLVNSEKVMEKMQETAAKTDDKTAVMAAGFKEIGTSIKNGMLDPLTIITFLLNNVLKANKQTVELGKALGKDSYTYRENLASAARSSTNINVTTENLIGAFSELAKETGFAYEFTVDQLETQVKLTKQVGLQADEAAQIQRLGVLNNKTSEETYNSFVKGLVATRNQLKVGIDFKATLAEATKVSGQLAANLGYNPERIAKAIVTAKAFGMTLEQVAKSGESLLNFETSIENELKAELLTGKQLNLERARAAALQGDQVALAEELAKNVGTAKDFAKMNVLQQKSLAEAVGMTTNELAETLRKREEAIKQGKSLAQITEEEATAAIERQTIQDRFNQSILKLQDFFGNLVAGPVGQLLESFATLLGTLLEIAGPVLSAVTIALVPINYLFQGISNLVGLIGEGLSTIAPILGIIGGLLLVLNARLFANAVLDIVKGAWSALGGIPFIGPVLAIGASLAGIGAIKKYAIGDMISPADGKTQVSTKEGGLFELSKNDDILAGPGLANKNSGGGGIGGGSIDITPMVTAINEVKAAVKELMNRPVIINMDSKQVGSSLVQNASYKSA